MTTWILPSSPDFFDIDSVFMTDGKCDWFQNIKSVNVGDIIYLYRSSPLRLLKWK